MKLKRLLRSWKRGTFKIIVLSLFILLITIIVLLDLNWYYKNFEAELGTRIAQVVIAYHAVLIAGMIFFGLGLGSWVDWMIRNERYIFRASQKNEWTELFMFLWGHEQPATNSTSEITEDLHSSVEIEPILLNRPTRRGRKPTFPLDRWLPIAAKWENRDPIRDAFTLGELIAEHLGTNPDGSPIVSEQTYYSLWRARAIEELKRRAKNKTTPTRHQPK